MPSQHKHQPISVRLPEADRAWLLEHAKVTGRPVNQIIAEAVAAKRAILAEYETALERSRRHPGDVASSADLLAMLRTVKILYQQERP